MTKSMLEDGIYMPVRRGDTDHLILSPPNVRVICEPLMGTSVIKGDHQRAEYPPLHRCIALYEKALSVVERWHTQPGHEYAMRDALFILGLYRRQVSATCSIEADVRLLAVAKAMKPKLTAHEWAMLEERMPEGIPIRRECAWERGLVEMNAPKILAAE